MKRILWSFVLIYCLGVSVVRAGSDSLLQDELASLHAGRQPWDAAAFESAMLDIGRYFQLQELPELSLELLEAARKEMLDSGYIPDHASWYIEMARMHYFSGEYEAALSQLFTADSLSANDTYQTKCRIHQWMGMSYAALSKDVLAEFDLQWALNYCDSGQLLLEEMEVRFLLGELRVGQGKYEGAFEFFEMSSDLADQLNDLGMRFRLASRQLKFPALNMYSQQELTELRYELDHMVGHRDALEFADAWMNAGIRPFIAEEEYIRWRKDLYQSLLEKRKEALAILWAGLEREYLRERNYEIERTEWKNAESAWDRYRAFLILTIVVLLGLSIFGLLRIRQLQGGATSALRKSRNMYRQLLLPFHLQNRDDGSQVVKRQRLILLMADLVNFKEVSEKEDHEVLIQLIDDLFSAFERIGELYALDKIKSMGETYLAAGGFTALTNVEVVRSMEAAFAMMEEANRQKMRAGGRGSLGFNVRIGLHIGEVTCGVTGWKKKSFDLWGEAVVEVARVVRLGSERYIHASESILEYLNHEPKFEFHPLHEESEQYQSSGVDQVRMHRT